MVFLPHNGFFVQVAINFIRGFSLLSRLLNCKVFVAVVASGDWVCLADVIAKPCIGFQLQIYILVFDLGWCQSGLPFPRFKITKISFVLQMSADFFRQLDSSCSSNARFALLSMRAVDGWNLSHGL